MTAPLTRLFVAVVLVNGAYDAVRVAVSYRVLALGGDAAQVGLVAATFAALPMLVALQFGRLVDRRGSWGVLAVGTAVSASAVALTAVAPSIPVLAAANAMVGLGQVMTLIAAQGFVMELTTRDRHVNGFAMFTLAVSVGQAVGTPVMGVLLQAGRTGEHVDTNPALWVMASAIVLSLPFALALPRSTPPARSAGQPRAESMTALLRRKGMPPSIFAALIVVTGFDLITAYMPVLGESVGLTPLVVTLLVATRSVFSMISRAATPWALRRWSQRAILIASPVVTTPAVVVLGLAGDAGTMFACLAVIGFFWGMNQPVTMNWVTAAAPPGERAAALSLRLTGNRAAQVLVPLGAGAIAGIAGPGSVFLLSGALTAASAATTSVSLRRHPFDELGRVGALPTRHAPDPRDQTTPNTRSDR
ncbi:MFS transporter [uncultured Dietzia sp.]|uniref:MFS transporter n=1 Tax=uncultured Dietzia sp. TaxID=395519 RepID=UPI0025F841AB|nr:MFS transporter [uncultured Dietzia sp.]